MKTEDILDEYFDKEIKDKFLYNMNKHWSGNCPEKKNILELMYSAFIWNNTSEGFDYWNSIYNKIYYKSWQKKS